MHLSCCCKGWWLDDGWRVHDQEIDILTKFENSHYWATRNPLMPPKYWRSVVGLRQMGVGLCDNSHINVSLLTFEVKSPGEAKTIRPLSISTFCHKYTNIKFINSDDIYIWVSFLRTGKIVKMWPFFWSFTVTKPLFFVKIFQLFWSNYFSYSLKIFCFAPEIFFGILPWSSFYHTCQFLI